MAKVERRQYAKQLINEWITELKPVVIGRTKGFRAEDGESADQASARAEIEFRAIGGLTYLRSDGLQVPQSLIDATWAMANRSLVSAAAAKQGELRESNTRAVINGMDQEGVQY